MIKICQICKNEYEAGGPSKAVRRKTCGHICAVKLKKQSGAYKWKLGKKITDPKELERLRTMNLGKKFSAETRLKMSIYRKLNPNRIRMGVPVGEETRMKMSLFQQGKKLGPDNPNWKGGTTPINQKIRHSLKYKLWREQVFERDDYTCQECGVRGGTLNADHIKPFSLYPNLRFSLENGRTLCRECHKKTETYGSKIFNYINNKTLCHQ